MPKENDLEGQWDQGGKHGGQKGMPKPEPKPKDDQSGAAKQKGTSVAGVTADAGFKSAFAS